jgi:hypothetical protein
MRRRYLLSE